jgi:uncharacterized protein YqeY
LNEVQSRLVADMKASMKAGDKPRLETVRLMIAALKAAQLQGSSDEMSVEQELDVLRKMVKSARDAIDQATQVGRDDIVAHETAQLEIVQGYLPQQLQGDALLAKIREVASDIGYQGPQDTGRFMKEWMARHKGLAEGRDVQAAIKQL